MDLGSGEGSSVQFSCCCMPSQQVIHAVAILKACLEFQPGALAPYLQLAQACMAADPKQRPCFVEVTVALRAMLAVVGQDPDNNME